MAPRRKTPAQARTSQFMFRLSRGERAEIKRRARAAGAASVADYIRDTALSKAAHPATVEQQLKRISKSKTKG